MGDELGVIPGDDSADRSGTGRKEEVVVWVGIWMGRLYRSLTALDGY